MEKVGHWDNLRLIPTDRTYILGLIPEYFVKV